MIYFDNAATTKPDKDALDFASKFNSDLFYNPSALYMEGLSINKEIKNSKEKILKCLGLSGEKYEVIFTSCGSESDNLAIFCSVKKGSYVTDKGEHSAVNKSFLELKQRGNTIEFIDLNKNGSVNEQKLFEYVKNNKVDFVSIMHVNNETGAINDINKIGKTIKEINPRIIFHVDGVQAFGKINCKICDAIDLYSISAHKINALKGTGALIRKKKVALSPLIHGGGQENGLRSGTENVFGIKVFEYATEKHYSSIIENFNKVNEIKNYIKENLNKDLFYVVSDDSCSPYILSISAVGLRGEVVMHSLEQFGIICGNGSACSSKNRYSRVIEACGYKNDILDGMIRLSFSQESTLDEAKFVTDKLNEIVQKLKGIMVK